MGCWCCWVVGSLFCKYLYCSLHAHSSHEPPAPNYADQNKNGRRGRLRFSNWQDGEAISSSKVNHSKVPLKVGRLYRDTRKNLSQAILEGKIIAR